MTAAADQLFVVTTRSRLRGRRFFPVMLVASIRVRRQLAQSHDVVRWASVVAGPTEFWTITVWRSREHMHDFMRSGAHDGIMWLFSRWLRSFWLMRWRPGPAERGDWDGLELARPERPADDGLVGRSASLEETLAHLPSLRAAIGPDGVASYDASRAARRSRAQLAGSGGAVVRVPAGVRVPTAWAAVRRVQRRLADDPAFLRATVGIGRRGDVYLLALWEHRTPADALVASPDVERLAARWPGTWANAWTPENEFGQWDGLRVRRVSPKVPGP